MKRHLGLCTMILAGVALSACGGGGSSQGFHLIFQAPDGSGLVGGQVGDLPYRPAVRQDVTLSPGIPVSGRVTDGSGNPIADARVTFRIATSAPPVDTDRTDAAGTYGVELPPGTWVAIVDSEDPALGSLTVAGIVVGQPGPVPIDFGFPDPVEVSGTVFDSGAVGIAGATIRFSGAASGSAVTVVCGPDGQYLARLVPDTYEAIVTPSGPSALTQLRQRFPGIRVPAALQRDFTLSAAVQVTGTVRDHLGLALLEDTEISVILPSDSAFFAPSGVETDPDTGTFAIGPVPTGLVTFRIEPPGDSGFPAMEVVRRVTGPQQETEDFNLVLGFVLSGLILRDDGATPEAEVRVRPNPRDGSLPPEDDRTDAAGRYEISLLPGTYDIEITPRNDNLQLAEVRVVTITGSTTLDVTLTRGAILTGRVLREDGVTRVPDIRVEIPGVRGAADVTDGDGLYTILAPTGTHTLQLTAEDGPFQDMALAPISGVGVTLPGPVSLDLTLSVAQTGGTVVHGIAYAPDGVTPVGGVELTARDATTGDTLGRTLSDATGSYVLVIP